MSEIKSLWGESDQVTEDALIQAAAAGDLEVGLLAIEGADAEARGQCRAALEDWAEQVRQAQKAADIHAQARAMIQVLGRTVGLRGDTRDYYDPQNSHLSAVVARRRGLPILLSSVWILVGRRAGIVVEGVGMPGHFIARVGGEGGVLVDPFEGGRLMSRDACEEVVARISQGEIRWQEDFLEQTSALDLLERVLRNLIHSHQQRRDSIGLYRHARLLAALRQDKPGAQLVHARLAEDIGATRLAIDLYEQLIERFAATPEAIEAGERLGPLHSRLRSLN